jgi:exonuclease SbcC
MKFKTEWLLPLINEDGDTPLELVEDGDWEDDGKYQYRDVIFKYDDKFYRVTDSRSGSYFSDYYYGHEDWGDEIECPEVEKIEVVTHEWKSKE